MLAEVGLFQLFVASFDLPGGFRMQPLEQVEEFAGIECVDCVVGQRARVVRWCADDDHGNGGVDLLERSEELFAGHVGQACVGNDAVDGREFAQGLDGFFAAVSGDDVEFGGFDDELAGGDSGGGFAVYYEETGTKHAGLDALSLKSACQGGHSKSGLIEGDLNTCLGENGEFTIDTSPAIGEDERAFDKLWTSQV